MGNGREPSNEGGITMPRHLSEQVVVITGASSGIGRATAIALGSHGATVVLAARNASALRAAAGDVERAGGHAHVVETDVADWRQVEHLASEAVERFGRIDTWVNNAAVVAYATVEETSVEEIEQILRVDLMGQIHGMKAALPIMRRQGGGAIINVASIEAIRSLPFHAPYGASKHGIKGFTEALRLELQHEGLPIHVTLVMPGSINTPFMTHARSKLGVKPLPLPPIYEPEIVAEAILHAAEHPTRDIIVGGAAKILSLMQRLSPTLVDWYLLQGGRGFHNQMTDEPDDGQDNLFAPMGGRGSVHGEFGSRSKSSSLYTQLFELRPAPGPALLGMAAAVGTVLLLRRWSHGSASRLDGREMARGLAGKAGDPLRPVAEAVGAAADRLI